MSRETNMALVRRAVAEIWNGLDLDLADTLFTPLYVNHGGIVPDLVTGPESMKFAVVLQHTAFPRLCIRERAMVAEDDLVELEWTAGRVSRRPGHATGDLLYGSHGTTLILCSDDQIKESWTTWRCPATDDVPVHEPGTGRTSLAHHRLAG